MIEVACSDLRNIADVFVTPIAWRRQYHDSPAFGFESVNQVAHGPDRCGIMRIVEDDLERMLVVNIHPPRRLEESRIEGAQSVPDIFEAFAHIVGQCRGKHRVLHVVHGAAFDGCRYQVRPQQRRMCFIIINCNHVAIHTLFEHESLSTGANMLFDQRVARIHRHVTQNLCFRVIGHLQAEAIIRIQHDGVFGNLYRHALDHRELFERLHALESEVIPIDIEARRYVAFLESEAAAKHAAAGDFHHRRID